MAMRRTKWGTRRTTSTRTSRTRGGNINRPWSTSEMAFMRKFYRKFETAWVARQLGRTVYSVRYKAVDLCIKKAAPSIWKGNRGASNAFSSFNKGRGGTMKTNRTTTKRRTPSTRSWRATSKKRTSRKSTTRRRTR
ncbi:MAG: hypothetical protein ACE5FH_11440 [Candidatus Zixiibacteriota bacterium]